MMEYRRLWRDPYPCILLFWRTTLGTPGERKLCGPIVIALQPPWAGLSGSGPLFLRPCPHLCKGFDVGVISPLYPMIQRLEFLREVCSLTVYTQRLFIYSSSQTDCVSSTCQTQGLVLRTQSWKDSIHGVSEPRTWIETNQCGWVRERLVAI